MIRKFAVFLVACGAPHCLFYIHAYGASVGIDNESVSKLLSISAAVDLVGRLGAGVIADAEVIDDYKFYFIGYVRKGMKCYL